MQRVAVLSADRKSPRDSDLITCRRVFHAATSSLSRLHIIMTMLTMARVTFMVRNIDPKFWGRVKAKAALEGTSVNALILRLLKEWLK